MLFVISYFMKRAVRERIKSLAVPILAFTLIVLINTLGGIKEWLDAEFENTMDNHVIIAEVSDLTGDKTDNLNISQNALELFTNPTAALSLYDFTSDLILKRSFDVILSDSQKETVVTAITGIVADDRLAPETGATVSFSGGYDDSIFQTDKPVAVVSEDVLAAATDGTLRITITEKLPDVSEFYFDPDIEQDYLEMYNIEIRQDSDGEWLLVVEGDNNTSTIAYLTPIVQSNVVPWYDYHDDGFVTVAWYLPIHMGWEAYWVRLAGQVTDGGYVTIEKELEIVGTVTGLGDGVIFSPFWAINSFVEEFEDIPFYTDRLSMTVADNRELSAFKIQAARSFARVRPIHTTIPLAMTVYDSSFYEAVEPLLQNIILVDIAIPVVYVISVCIGFLASTLLTRARRSEFAVMRSVGIHRRDIFTGILSEQFILSLIGAAVGSGLTIIVFGSISIIRPAILLGCYVLGTVFAGIKVSGTNVLEVMKEKE
ncbi:MAG: ABC transporter permease [Oscillospiraceae bacterium]|nr:ABC transporter permease [Oscillospiraceae bacterium]